MKPTSTEADIASSARREGRRDLSMMRDGCSTVIEGVSGIEATIKVEVTIEVITEWHPLA